MSSPCLNTRKPSRSKLGLAYATAAAVLLAGAAIPLGCAGDDDAPTADAGTDAAAVIDGANYDGPDACSLPTPSLASHSPGTDCLSCHNGTQASDLSVAGTLYGDAAGSSPLARATVTVRDSAGVELSMVTTTSGNFLSHQAVTPPLTVSISRCELSAAMTAAAPERSCNTAGCHGSAPIHLP